LDEDEVGDMGRVLPLIQRVSDAWQRASAIALPINLSQHPDQHRPERWVLLRLDQQLGESPVPESSTCMRAISSRLPFRPWKVSHGKKVARTRLVMNGAMRSAATWGNPANAHLMAELLIDCEEDRTLRAVLVGMLLEAERSGPS
jgi:hypothetical protein